MSEKKLSQSSIKSYGRFLDIFKNWLISNDLKDLKPQQFTNNHLEKYRHFLTNYFNPNTKKELKKTTQNLYLITLRNLLNYLTENGIPSLLPSKIKLLKEEKIQIDNNYFSFKIVNKLLNAPDITKVIGLRDRAILEILFSSALKVSEISALNRNHIIFHNNKNSEVKIFGNGNISPRLIYFSEKANYWLNKYLCTRKDVNKALFINYHPNKNSDRRLSVRSIERMIKGYVKDIDPSLPFTPETLRNVYTLTLLNQEDKEEITKPNSHETLEVDTHQFLANHRTSNNLKEIESYPFSSWRVIETCINKEINWLKYNIQYLSEGYTKKTKPSILNCENCILRKIAILIASGRIKAIELKAKSHNYDLWNGLTKIINKSKHRHGKEWHRMMMTVIEHFFESQGYKINIEPNLNYGRADLGVSIESNNLYIEIGTVSLFKLWYNFSTMRNSTFLIVPSEKYAIEFKT